MNADYEPSEEFIELLVALTDGRLNLAQRNRLTELIKSDSGLRQYYVEYMGLHGMLAWHHGGVPVMELPLEMPKFLLPGRRRSSKLPIAAGWFIAASVLTAVGFGIWYELRGTAPPPVATVLRGEDFVWEGNDPAVAGDPIPIGPRTLSSGTVQIELDSGVVVAIQGYATFSFADGMRFVLNQGVIRVLSPPTAAGFIVQAGQVEVVDLGTEFGVSVDKHYDVEVLVEQGKVQIRNLNRTLTAGQSIRINHKMEIEKRVRLQSKNYPKIGR